jgi:hypothetical protein
MLTTDVLNIKQIRYIRYNNLSLYVDCYLYFNLSYYLRNFIIFYVFLLFNLFCLNSTRWGVLQTVQMILQFECANQTSKRSYNARIGIRRRLFVPRHSHLA